MEPVELYVVVQNVTVCCCRYFKMASYFVALFDTIIQFPIFLFVYLTVMRYLIGYIQRCVIWLL
jgi:hypothetical protein